MRGIGFLIQSTEQAVCLILNKSGNMTNIPPYDKLDPRVQRTVSLFFDAFVGLLKEKHYQYIKVQEITKAAQLNRATFYNHFENKEEFILFCSREGFRRELIARFPIALFVYSTINFKELLTWVLEFMAAEYANWHFQWDEILFEKALRIEFYHYLTVWINNPNQPNLPQPVSKTYLLALSASVIGVAMVWCENNCVESVNELSETIAGIFMSGLPEPINGQD